MSDTKLLSDYLKNLKTGLKMCTGYEQALL